MNPSPTTPATVTKTKPENEVVFLENPRSREVAFARRALREFGKQNLRDQSAGSRVEVEIGGVRTFWTRGLAPVPPYIQLVREGEQLLLVWNKDDSALHIFRRSPDASGFARVQTVTKHSAIFSWLPRYAFVPGQCQHRPSLAQLVTMRKLLGIAPSGPIPDLHIASATRIISSIVLEPMLTRFFGDVVADAGVIATPAAGGAQ